MMMMVVNDGSNDSQWIHCDKCSLNIIDKGIIENGDQLTDKHTRYIAIQISKKHQFPLVGGCHGMHSIQIIHCTKRKYWITKLTKGCSAGELNASLINQIVNEGHCKANVFIKSFDKIKMIPVEKKSGSKDGGLFAIQQLHIATSLAYSEDTLDVAYDQGHT